MLELVHRVQVEGRCLAGARNAVRTLQAAKGDKGEKRNLHEVREGSVWRVLLCISLWGVLWSCFVLCGFFISPWGCVV